MAVELSRLLEKVKHMDITLAAGGGGIHNVVTWVHMVESLEVSAAFRNAIFFPKQEELYIVPYCRNGQIPGWLL